jgi:hypothetical protein
MATGQLAKKNERGINGRDGNVSRNTKCRGVRVKERFEHSKESFAREFAGKKGLQNSCCMEES